MTDHYAKFRYIGKKRRAVEHKRFVSGQGRYAADIHLPGILHVALVASPYASARILGIDATEALAMPGVHAVLTADELCAAVDAVLPGVDAPAVKRYPLARDVVRYAGEWVAAVVADT
ncbi:MAG: xanthine dehydrogenase family protein molybdopterin-binding subunit, partial [Burkholderiaceae bacterium]